RDGLKNWLDDPGVAPSGGEPFGRLAHRVGEALDLLRAAGGEHLVVTSAGPIKAAVLLALDAPVASVWRIDVAPGSVTRLDADASGRWTVRALNLPPQAAR
ncbi:MAG: histidine phosphatase family protein, partial [Nitriliruptoraceae bacterium]